MKNLFWAPDDSARAIRVAQNTPAAAQSKQAQTDTEEQGCRGLWHSCDRKGRIEVEIVKSAELRDGENIGLGQILPVSKTAAACHHCCV